MAYTPYKTTQPLPARREMGMTGRPTFTQYQAPDNQATEQKVMGRVNQMLDQPGTLSPDVVSKLKARSKEQGLAMADQKKAEAQQFLTQRGFSAAGGTRQAANQQIDMGVINQILGANRDLDVNAAVQNRQDLLQALGAADSAMNNRGARSADAYRNVLAGQGAQTESDFRLGEFLEGGRRFDADFDLRKWAMGEQAAQAGDDSAFRQLTGDRNFGLDMRRLDENSRQFNDSMGYNYANLNMQGNQNLLNFLMSTLG
jgi:hypothetical protein